MKQLVTKGIKCLTYEFRRYYCNKSFLKDLLLNMPRENKHTATLKTHRTKMKEKYSKYAPGIVYLQVLGSGAIGAPKSLYLFTDQSRYLFNCGEGSQRLAHEHKMKLTKLEHIFVTHGTWENIGGLPGVALTIQDVGVPEITLHGPNGISKILPATKKFVVLRNLLIKTANCSKDTDFEDNAIKVKYIPLTTEENERTRAESLTRSPRSDLTSSDDDTDYYAHEKTLLKCKNRNSSEKPRSYHYENDQLWRHVMCFAVTLQPRPGTLCLQKCVEAGVKPGPLLGKLKAGEDIVLTDGKVVRSADVTLPGSPSPTFLVVECPNESFLSTLEKEPMFLNYQMSAPNTNDVAFLVVHFTPIEIMNLPLYRKWMARFPPSTHHLLLNEQNTCMGSTAVHRIQYKLNTIDPSIFPLLNDPGFNSLENTYSGCNGHTEKLRLNGKEKTVNSEADLSSNYSIIAGKTVSKIHLRPHTYVDNSTILKIDPDEYKSEVMNIEGFSMQLHNLKTSLSTFSSTKYSKYPHLVFLGTGSCIPNKTRNTSGILINLSEHCRMLLDCGEGTYGQLVRYYGPDNIAAVLNDLKAIYVSHMHADHHIGLMSLLKAKLKLSKNNANTMLLAPKQILPWLTFYDSHFEPVLYNLELVPNSDMLYNNKLSEGCQVRLQDSLGIRKIETAYVKHCQYSFGISILHQDGWKITYSGDTMPSESLIVIGANSDILIHEATMEDELILEAKSKLHSTTSQAIEMGKKMAAKYTILTHFSQRYAKLPRITCNSETEEPSLGDDVGIAFDNMQVSFNDLPKLHLLYPTLKLMFQEDYEELEQKALKRQLKQERIDRKKPRINSGSVS